MATSQGDDDNVMSENNLTPLIIVMLILLILLFVAVPMLPNAVPVTLPKATTDLLIPPQVAPDRISVTGDGALYFDDIAHSESELKDHIGSIVESKDATVEIMADEQIEYEIVSKIMNSWPAGKHASNN